MRVWTIEAAVIMWQFVYSKNKKLIYLTKEGNYATFMSKQFYTSITQEMERLVMTGFFSYCLATQNIFGYWLFSKNISNLPFLFRLFSTLQSS